VLGAAAIVGETAARRFRSRAAFARFTGTAPIPVWSGDTSGKVRLNRGGNRRVNCALHMIAVTQARGIGPGKDYLDKTLAPRPPGDRAPSGYKPRSWPRAESSSAVSRVARAARDRLG
jgi:hypothetical protein